jgi:hypothetical protein
MSNYLDSLVAKARNVANAVQPRPSSPFEPSAAAGTPITGGDGVFAPEEGLSGAPSFDRSRSTSPPLEHATHKGQPRIDVNPSPGAVAPLPRVVANADAHHGSTASSGSSWTTPAARASIIKEGPLDSGPDSGDARVRSRPARDPESVFTPRPQPARPATIISREQVISLLRAAPQDGSGAVSAQDEAPTIKISIGRVDVRAIMPTTPAPRPAAARRASVSLDEYLKHQGERKR